MPPDVEPFGTLSDGTAVALLTLRSRTGVEVRVCNYGGIITAINAPDRNGTIDQITLGVDSLAAYQQQHAYFGAVVGRCANRIARGRFALDGTSYQLATNEPPHHLHGGWRGFDRHLWDAVGFDAPAGPAVRLSRISPAGEEGYPGTLTASVEYCLSEDGTLHIDYAATTDAPTIVNLTQHSYFNLAGRGDTIDDHVLTLHADRFTPIDEGLIPTGQLVDVAGTPFDFRAPRRIGDGLRDDHVQLQRAGGYDHNWEITRATPGCVPAAELFHPASGRRLHVATTAPGVQFYSGNFLDGTIRGRHGVYQRRAGLCLETQHFPDAPNHPAFASVVLRPGERFRSRTVWTFLAD